MAQNDPQSATSPFPALCEKLKAIDAQYNPCQCQYATLDTEDQMTARSNIIVKFPDHQNVTFGENFKAIYKPGQTDR